MTRFEQYIQDYNDIIGIHKHCRVGEINPKDQSPYRTNKVEAYLKAFEDRLFHTMVFLNHHNRPDLLKEMKQQFPHMRYLNTYYKRYKVLGHGAIEFNKTPYAFVVYRLLQKPNMPFKLELIHPWVLRKTHVSVCSEMLRFITSKVLSLGVQTVDPFSHELSNELKCITLKKFYKIYSQ